MATKSALFPFIVKAISYKSQTCLPWTPCLHFFLAQEWQHLGQLPWTRDGSPILTTAGQTPQPGSLGTKGIRAAPTLSPEALEGDINYYLIQVPTFWWFLCNSSLI